jgi:hypothetical protein
MDYSYDRRWQVELGKDPSHTATLQGKSCADGAQSFVFRPEPWPHDGVCVWNQKEKTALLQVPHSWDVISVNIQLEWAFRLAHYLDANNWKVLLPPFQELSQQYERWRSTDTSNKRYSIQADSWRIRLIQAVNSLEVDKGWTRYIDPEIRLFVLHATDTDEYQHPGTSDDGPVSTGDELLRVSSFS